MGSHGLKNAEKTIVTLLRPKVNQKSLTRGSENVIIMGIIESDLFFPKILQKT